MPSSANLTPADAVARVTVLGSLNADIVCRLTELPRPGHTVLAQEVAHHWGGKGANQAVAAARFGACVSLVGALGADDVGQRYLAHLQRENVATEHILQSNRHASGSAHVYVDARAENMIVVNPGANTALDEEIVGMILPSVLRTSDVLLLSLETPLPSVLAALRLAQEFKVRTVLNASPVATAFPWRDCRVDVLVINEHECAQLFQISALSLAIMDRRARGHFLAERNLGQIVVTRGADSTLFIAPEEIFAVPTRAVTPFDTVGAGDTFAGVLAAQLVPRAIDWRDVIWHANVAAALSTLKPGAQTAMPVRAEVLAAAEPRIPAETEVA